MCVADFFIYAILILPGVMRIIVTAKQALVPSYERILNRLAAILSVTLKNPSNPMFDQWLFEGTSALVRYFSSSRFLGTFFT